MVTLLNAHELNKEYEEKWRKAQKQLDRKEISVMEYESITENLSYDFRRKLIAIIDAKV